MAEGWRSGNQGAGDDEGRMFLKGEGGSVRKRKINGGGCCVWGTGRNVSLQKAKYILKNSPIHTFRLLVVVACKRGVDRGCRLWVRWGVETMISKGDARMLLSD